MATLPSPTIRTTVAEPIADSSDPIQFEAYLKDHADWAGLIEMVRDANELVRLARALIPVDAP